MLKAFSRACVTLVQKYLPDPFIFAIILSIVVFVLGIISAGNTPMQMVIHWGKGFWGLLTFSMQMCLVLVTGFALAKAPAVHRFLKAIAKRAKTPAQAIVVTTFVSAIACWINWGFGLIVGALLAREIAKEVRGVDYRLLIASAYSGFVVWHAGLSGSIPLAVAGPGHLAEKIVGIVPVSETIFSPMNLFASILIIVTLPFVNRFMHPDPKDAVTIDPKLLADETAATTEPATGVKPTQKLTPAQRLENSWVLTALVGLCGVIYLIYHFATRGADLNLNIVNLIFLTAGIILHGTPMRYVKAVEEAAKGCAGIILQFPFYAGIMGMMVDSGLAAVISNWFVSISTARTFPLFTYWSAGIINLFVPSGGGQWAVQGPIMMPAGVALGVPAGKVAMGIAWGDAWTNMIQPFWALPALAIAGLSARDIMGYCVVVLLWTGIITSAAFLLF